MEEYKDRTLRNLAEIAEVGIPIHLGRISDLRREPAYNRSTVNFGTEMVKKTMLDMATGETMVVRF